MSNPRIPKPVPARRLTISAPEFIKPRLPSSTKTVALASARIVKRRSTNLDRLNGKNLTNTIDQRQRVQFGRIRSTNQNVPPAGTETNKEYSVKMPKSGTLKCGFLLLPIHKFHPTKCP